MKLYILDTDHVSLFQRDHPSVIAKIKETFPEQLAVTIITVEEQMRGRLAQIKRASQKSAPPQKLIKAFEELKKGAQYFCYVRVLDFDMPAEAQFKNLHLQKLRVGVQDLRIAAIALATNNVLVTRNRHDFEKIPGLMLEDWSKRA
ncbi:MAG: type II toxin-antitoxin system VapC family toxin [candidate division KSB1 bacterium]